MFRFECAAFGSFNSFYTCEDFTSGQGSYFLAFIGSCWDDFNTDLSLGTKKCALHKFSYPRYGMGTCSL